MTNLLERRSGILLGAGLGMFALAFASNAIVPMVMYRDLPEQTALEVVNQNTLYQLEDLRLRYPGPFNENVGEATAENCAELLRTGRQVYIAEGCWHCHSQVVRPVSNEPLRWGAVPTSSEYQNELQRPVMFGTRRVGPDLSREGGRRSNDWHAVHFWQPNTVSPHTRMPRYTWLFDGAPDKPNRRGLGLIMYVQWLGSWLESYPAYEDYLPLEKQLANPPE